MTVDELIATCRSRQIALWPEGDQLRFRAPEGSLDAGLLQSLREAKAALMTWLRAGTCQPDDAHLHEPFPLTPVQAAYVLGRHASFAFGGTACHLYAEYEWPADLDVQRAQARWNDCVQRHPMLRAIIEDSSTQRILPDVPHASLVVHDQRLASAAGCEAHIAAVRMRLDHAQHALDTWPVLQPEFTLTPSRSLLHLSVDFALLDFASLQMLLAEWRHRYEAADATFAPLAISFRDCVLHDLRAGALSAEAARDRAWWWSRMPDLPGAPELPLRADAAQAPPRFSHAQTQLSPEDWQRLSRTAQALGLSPSGAVLAAFADVIGRWSSTPAFSLNLTVLNRRSIHPQVDQVLGDFTALSLLAVQPAPEENFVQRARRLGTQMFDDLDHSLCSAVDVLRELARQRGPDAARAPVVFTCGIGSHQQLLAAQGPGLTAQAPVHMISQTPQVWLDCQVTDQFGGLLIAWDVRQGIFPDTVPPAMFQAFSTLLDRLARDPQAWHLADPMTAELAGSLTPSTTADRVPVEDHLQLPGAWSLMPGERSLNVAAGFWCQAQQRPHAQVVTDAGGPLSYAEVAQAATAVRRSLAAHGIGPGRRVAVRMPRSAEQLIAVLGVLWAGAAYVPIDRRQPAARQQVILETAEAAAVLTPDEGPHGEAATTPTLPHITVQRFAQANGWQQEPPHSVQGDDLAYIIFTSGSTGTPKGVMLGHAAVIRTLQALNDDHAVGPTDRLLCLTELSFDLSVYDLLGATAAGAQLVIPSPDRTGDPSHWAALMRSHGVTLWNSVPAQGSMLMDYLEGESERLNADALPAGPRCVLWSGDWIPTSLPTRWWRRWPKSQLFSLGGATEAAIWSIRHPIRTEDTALASIPYGRALRGHTVEVLDTLGRPCPPWVRGEIHIGGDGLALGYAQDPERTRQRFIQHPGDGRRLYRTGDWGRYRDDGAIEFLGREDDQVKILGHRIELAEVDAALMAHPGLAAAATLAEGERSHRRLISFAVPRLGRPTPTALQASLQQVADAVQAQVALLDWPAPDRLAAMLQALQQACAASLAEALRRIDARPSADSSRRDESTGDDGAAHARSTRLLRHWQAFVLDHPCPLDAQTAWQQFDQQADPRLWPDALRAYLQSSAMQLVAQLDGEIAPASLMFPEGSTHVARAMYTEGLHARALHLGMAQAVAAIVAREPEREWRILEIGAGTGAASQHILEALASRVAAGQRIVYHFTDVSDFFLAEAARRFHAWPWVRFQRLDMNTAFSEQGVAPQSLDLILSSGALNNARHTPEVIARMREASGPDAWWVLQDLTGEHPEISVSQALMMEVPTDERSVDGALFASTAQWLRWLQADGSTCAWPAVPPGSGLQALGYEIFLARVQADGPALNASEILAQAAQRVPHYMLPSELHVLHHWPHTVNGKIDRKALAALAATVRAARPSLAFQSSDIPVPAKEPAHAQHPEVSDAHAERLSHLVDRLVDRLVGHWEAVLGTQGLTPEQDFFTAGGDSLMLAQLISRLRKQEPCAQQHPFDRLLRQALSTGTPAAMAAFLLTPTEGETPRTTAAAPHATAQPTPEPTLTAPASDGREAPRPRRHAPTGPRRAPVKPLQLSQGSGLPRVIVHEGLGTLHAYRPLVPLLTRHGPVWGFSVHDAQDYLDIPAEHLHATLGHRYAQAIVQSGLNEVTLLGYCSGGLLAFEMAKSLVQLGVRVPMLDIVSSHHIPYRIDDELLVLWNYARTLGLDTGQGMAPLPSPAQMAQALHCALATTPGHLAPQALHTALAQLGVQLPPPDALRQQILAEGATSEDEARQAHALRYRIFAHSVRACQADTTAAYTGPARLFIPETGNPLIPAADQALQAYWTPRVIGPLASIRVAGGHFDCLNPHAPWVHHHLLGVQA